MITILLKFIASAALLFAFYRLVLRGKASYTVSRAYLLALPVVSLLMSVLSFEVYTPAATEIIAEQFEPLTFTFDNESTAPVTVATLSETEMVQAEMPVAPVVEETAAPKRTIVINWMAVLEWAVPAISLILLLLAFWHIRKVLVIKSKMKIESTAEGYDLIRSSLVKTPFSFARTIFLPAGLNEHRESLIIRHERAHIAHRHYADVWFIEFLTRLFWFNPFVWLCRAELRNVHEFQADHDVIASHISINDYQTTLLEMVMNVSSPVVNGFNHSFIRQRFIEMKSTAAGTLGRVAKAVTLAWIAGLFCAFTFTACKPDAKNKISSVAGLKECRSMVTISHLLTQSWVYIDRNPDTPNKKMLKDIQNKQFPNLQVDLLLQSRKWDAADREELESIFTYVNDSLFYYQKSIMKALNTLTDYEDMFVAMDAQMMVEDDGEESVATEKTIARIDALIEKIGK